VSSDQGSGGDSTPAESVAARTQRRGFNALALGVLLVVVVVIVDALALIFAPPFDPQSTSGACEFPVCFINGNFEFPAPATVIGTAPESGQIVTFAVGISSTLFTMWVIGGGLIVAGFFLGRLRKDVPGRVQNFSEWVFESIRNFGLSIGGPQATPYIPIFAAFLLFILMCNWAGLVPPVGKVEFLRAPTSDVNITIGLALVSFVYFQAEGFRRLGVRGYLGKYFPFYEFRHGVGAGLIAMFVGLIELMLELVKPITLSMRLFGNIYAGEVAIGVITALTVTLVPVALLLLEGMLNLIQALIFSVLTLVFITTAIEPHHEEEGQVGEEAIDSLEGRQPHPAGAH
jgi:F-type H+-transporting ATPase subunit a